MGWSFGEKVYSKELGRTALFMYSRKTENEHIARVKHLVQSDELEGGEQLIRFVDVDYSSLEHPFSAYDQLAGPSQQG